MPDSKKTEAPPPSNAFGKKVKHDAEQLLAKGRDANQVAKILCDADPDGCNYGIGIVLDSGGKPVSTSETLLEYARKELQASGGGSYRNSVAAMTELKQAVLRWQRIPEPYWDSFLLFLPSDAGTGAVVSAVEIALAMDVSQTGIGVEERGWPGYKAIAKMCRIALREYPANHVITGREILPVYQAGPQNTTGRVTDSGIIAARAEEAAKTGRTLILDRAYSGFEFASQLAEAGYDTLMRKSCAGQLEPFLAKEVPLWIAISPTKCFRSFALRPAGFLLAFLPNREAQIKAEAIANACMRARGSSFEHPLTRALVNAMIGDLSALEGEHTAVLTRLAEAERIWTGLSRETSIEQVFSASYSGLFRNLKASTDAEEQLYDAHIYPVLSDGRCRINVTGIPGEAQKQAAHVAAFAHSCAADAG